MQNIQIYGNNRNEIGRTGCFLVSSFFFPFIPRFIFYKSPSLYIPYNFTFECKLLEVILRSLCHPKYSDWTKCQFRQFSMHENAILTIRSHFHYIIWYRITKIGSIHRKLEWQYELVTTAIHRFDFCICCVARRHSDTPMWIECAALFQTGKLSKSRILRASIEWYHMHMRHILSTSAYHSLSVSGKDGIALNHMILGTKCIWDVHLFLWCIAISIRSDYSTSSYITGLLTLYDLFDVLYFNGQHGWNGEAVEFQSIMYSSLCRGINEWVRSVDDYALDSTYSGK